MSGILPFDRDGCYFDELLMAAVLSEAEESLNDRLSSKVSSFGNCDGRRANPSWHAGSTFDQMMRDTQRSVASLRLGHIRDRTRRDHDPGIGSDDRDLLA